eukprot:Nk52_evm81s1810 gene=Nk52_evmTU81s1810
MVATKEVFKSAEYIDSDEDESMPGREERSLNDNSCIPVEKVKKSGRSLFLIRAPKGFDSNLLTGMNVNCKDLTCSFGNMVGEEYEISSSSKSPGVNKGELAYLNVLLANADGVLSTECGLDGQILISRRVKMNADEVGNDKKRVLLKSNRAKVANVMSSGANLKLRWEPIGAKKSVSKGNGECVEEKTIAVKRISTKRQSTKTPGSAKKSKKIKREAE